MYYIGQWYIWNNQHRISILLINKWQCILFSHLSLYTNYHLWKFSFFHLWLLSIYEDCVFSFADLIWCGICLQLSRVERRDEGWSSCVASWWAYLIIELWFMEKIFSSFKIRLYYVVYQIKNKMKDDDVLLQVQ